MNGNHYSCLMMLVIILACELNAGSMLRTSFLSEGIGSADSNLLVTSSGIGLAVNYEKTIKLFGDTLPKAVNISHYPDVLFSGKDTINAFYIDSIPGTQRVMKQQFRLQKGGVVSAEDPVKIFNLNEYQPYSYLHVDKGENGYLAACVQKTQNLPYRSYTYLHNGTSSRIEDSSDNSKTFLSQCRFDGDTFLVVKTIRNFPLSEVYLEKIYSRGSAINRVQRVLVDTSNNDSLRNCTVTADSNGNILVIVLHGTTAMNKQIRYQFYSRDLVSGSTGTYPPLVADNNYYGYEDVAAASYGPGKFAIVSWDASGLLLHRLTPGGPLLTDRVINRPDIKFCTVAASGNYLIVACMGDADGNGIRCIEGIRYRIAGGEPDSALGISFSDPSIPVVTSNPITSSAINAAVDDSGAFMIVWRNGSRVAGCIWAHRQIRYARAYYQSPVETLQIADDSLHFNRVSAPLNDSTLWFTTSFLRYGPTAAACAAAPWISFTDNSELSNNRTKNCYFQYKIYIDRKTAGLVDSFLTPEISSVTVPWNAQPRFTGTDTVNIGGTYFYNVQKGDTCVIVARRDTSYVAAAGIDSDIGDAVTVTSSSTATPQVQTFSGGAGFTARFAISPFARSDTVYSCSLALHDNEGWSGVPAILRYRTVNLSPQLVVILYHNNSITGTEDSLELMHDTVLTIQEEDSIAFTYAVSDSNDPQTVTGRFLQILTDGTVVVDSVSQGRKSTVSVVADTVIPRDTVRYRIESADPDMITDLNVGVIINHKPVMRYIVHNGDTLYDNDTAYVVLDDTVRFTLAIDDTDCWFGDTIQYSSECGGRINSVKNTLETAVLEFVTDSTDTLIHFHATDRFGRTDSMHLHLAYPWFETDSMINPGYFKGIRHLSDSVSMIAGSSAGDTVELTILNSGRNDLSISGCEFEDGSGSWAQVLVKNGTDTFTISSVSNKMPHVVNIAPDSQLDLQFHFSSKTLTGDSIRYDSLVLVTNDPRHRRVVIALRIEHNDLPRIVSVGPWFIADVPYRTIAKRASYRFPPHAVISIAFSEPMDTTNALDAITVYSIFDRVYTGIIEPIPVRVEWLQNNTVANLSPVYERSSPRFRLKPPAGLFIPTDSIAVQLTSDLHDRAATPGGPNALDVDRNYVRDLNTDTLLAMRIDSISFTVSEIGPAPGSTGLPQKVSIRLTFSSPVYAASVDTSLTGNRSLVVRSDYNNMEPLAFEAIIADSITVEFRLMRELFYRDTLECSYFSRWLTDRTGYATDNDHNGIDATIFDSLADDDNLQWGYRIRPVDVLSVDPDSADKVDDVSPSITIRFNGKIPGGAFDTDTGSGNRSFRISSGRTGYSSLRSVQYLSDSTGVTIRPKMNFFSNDSVYCRFIGFSSRFQYNATVNLPVDTLDCFSSYAWHFHSGEIGFYTYPNPYKPNSDPRHCASDGPCGIWFKNLHTLAKDVHEMTIRIYSMNAHPVFDSGKRGKPVRFDETGTDNLPQWKWDTRNNRGEPVATGIYFYTICNVDGSILKKGKLIIVR